ncbi:MAG: hypothetical protein JSV24_08160, partial [Bacteroidales bacterium]
MQLSTIHSRIIAISVVAVFATSLIWFFLNNPFRILEKRVPGMDNRPSLIGENDSVTIGEFFELYSQPEVSSSSSWPHFRGSDYSNIVVDPGPVPDSWPDDGPPVVWQIKVGEGHAAA